MRRLRNPAGPRPRRAPPPPLLRQRPRLLLTTVVLGGVAASLVGLTGTQAEVEDAQRRAGVALAEAGGETHATSLFLYDTDNRARVMFTAGGTADEIARDLERLAPG